MSDLIATAEAIRQATQNSMIDEEVMLSARVMLEKLGVNLTDEAADLLFEYSANLASTVTTNVVHAVMPESQFNQMVEAIMAKDLEDELEKILGESD